MLTNNVHAISRETFNFHAAHSSPRQKDLFYDSSQCMSSKYSLGTIIKTIRKRTTKNRTEINCYNYVLHYVTRLLASKPAQGQLKVSYQDFPVSVVRWLLFFISKNVHLSVFCNCSSTWKSCHISRNYYKIPDVGISRLQNGTADVGRPDGSICYTHSDNTTDKLTTTRFVGVWQARRSNQWREGADF
jgi:hypothetical protein